MIKQKCEGCQGKGFLDETDGYDYGKVVCPICVNDEEPKQQTLEEEFSKQLKSKGLEFSSNLNPLDMFELGANWQSKRMYSEEEVRELLIMQRGNSYVAILTKTKDKELASIASTAPEPCGKDGWVKKK